MLLTSLQNPLVKHLCKLRKSKPYRIEQNSALVMGRTLIQELEKDHSFKIILTTSGDSTDKTYLTTEAILKKITGLVNPDPILAEIELPKSQALKAPLLILDRITDPGNLGTLLRSALAFGYQGAFLLDGCCDPYNDKALRAAKGATFQLPLKIGTWDECQKLTENLPIYYGDLKGEKASPMGPHALVLSNETHGPSNEIHQNATPLNIPIQNIESLNVAIAGSILMHQLRGDHG